MGYNLEQLGPIGFQDLAAALVLESFGVGVQVMGAGRDGGRDLYHDGPLVWKATEDGTGEVWEGYTVFQVKHKARLSSRPEDDASWLWGQIRKELDEWADPKSGRNPVPDFLVVVTNVPLTPVPGAGGHDRLRKAIQDYIDKLEDSSHDVDDGSERRARHARISKIQKWRVWDENQIKILLTRYKGVRNAFPGFLTAADVFAHLTQFTNALPIEQLGPGLRAHARTTLIGESAIYFDEAGSGDGSGIPVHEVVIDLPVTSGNGGERASVIGNVLDRGERMLRPKLTVRRGPRHLVVAGAPGNGKTTISKFLVQVYRAAMLAGASDLSGDHVRVISGTEDALNRMGRSLPRHRRWAMRIDLAEYAQENGFNEDSTLIRYLAERVSKRSDLGDVKPSALVSWMRQWPWFLVLDGLDEVTEPAVRKRLIQRVTEFVTTAEADDCDVFVVLTTRPIGYVENIAPTQFERVDLDYLEPPEAVSYGTLVTRVRLRNDLDRFEKVVRQLTRAAEDDALKNLLRTPLQVLIMTIIMGAAGQLAPDRFSLFWGYYDTVFKRERDKQSGFHWILQNHGQQIQQLHARVGFELQVRSEAGDRSHATLTGQELEDLTWQVLHDAGFKPSGADADLHAKILTSATHRLVLIAPRGDHGYGFDVRSLQELMAATYLTTGPLDVVTTRLRIAAPSPHWRNTWIFAAGRLFSTPQDHEHRAAVELVESIDKGASGRLGDIVPVGPRLALDLVDDGMARSLPIWRDRLIRCGLRILHEPTPPDLPAVARVLVRFADTGDEQRKAIEEALRDALGTSGTARTTAEQLQALIGSVAAEIHARTATRGLRGVRKRPGSQPPSALPDGWPDFEDEVTTYPAPEEILAKVRQAAVSIRNITKRGTASEGDVDAIITALTDERGAPALNAALQHVTAHEPVLVGTLRDDVVPGVLRTAIGERLRGDPRGAG
ncbi:NACHT domain-containing protein [Amycolatopsis pigmentata]|uniref:NACHT domain-containing protein n=1 Tax=Amycolatopsis pigmentata TaxID=450801 RepID=A0ABW5FIP4_9PSEU